MPEPAPETSEASADQAAGGAERRLPAVAWPGRITPGVQLLALGCLAVPVLTVKWPVLLDYPNHLVRMWLVSGGVSLWPLSEIYRVDWHNAATDIGVDVIALILGHVLPISAVARLALLMALALPPLGAACLNRTAFRGAHWWQVAVVTLAWSTTIVAGFLNFQIGLGVALLGAALDPVLARRAPWLAVGGRMAFAALTFIVHAFAFAFYVALLGALELGPQFAPLRSGRGALRAVGRAVLRCLPTLVPLVLLLALAGRLPGQSPSGGDISWPRWQYKWIPPLTPFLTYDKWVDAAFALALAAPIGWAAATRRLGVHAGLFVCATSLGVLSAFMPAVMAGAGWLHVRLPAMVALTLAASLRPQLALARAGGWAALALAFALPVTRTLWVTRVWGLGQRDAAAVEHVLEHVPSGAAVLTTEHAAPPDEVRRARTGRYLAAFRQPTYWHLATLAILQRRAFVPTLFTTVGKHPVVVLPPWNEIAVGEGSLPAVDLLDRPGATEFYPYLRRWRDRFDFVLVLNADLTNETGPLPPGAPLRLVAREGFAELYQVVGRAEERGDVRPAGLR